jgi:hypothetical protein
MVSMTTFGVACGDRAADKSPGPSCECSTLATQPGWSGRRDVFVRVVMWEYLPRMRSARSGTWFAPRRAEPAFNSPGLCSSPYFFGHDSDECAATDRDQFKDKILRVELPIPASFSNLSKLFCHRLGSLSDIMICHSFMHTCDQS